MTLFRRLAQPAALAAAALLSLLGAAQAQHAGSRTLAVAGAAPMTVALFYPTAAAERPVPTGPWQPVVANLRAAQASTVAGAGHFAFMVQSTVPLPSAAGDAAADPEGFDRAAFLAELENQVAGFFADPWR